MTKQQFDFIARMLRSKEPVISGVRLVIFKDMDNAEAARQSGVTPQSLHRSTGRFLAMHQEICETFKNSLV